MKQKLVNAAVYADIGALTLDEVTTALKEGCSCRPIIDDGVTITDMEEVRNCVERTPVNDGEKLIKKVAESDIPGDTYVIFYE
jgi:succinyl-CoA synthetase alpha subunit